MSQLRSFFSVFKKVVKILEQHYVGRADKIIILNAPNFRNVAYLVFPLIPPQVKAKIEILGRSYQKRLREVLLPVRCTSKLKFETLLGPHLAPIGYALLLFCVLSVEKEEIPKSYGGDSDIAEGEWELELCIKANLAGTILGSTAAPPESGNGAAESTDEPFNTQMEAEHEAEKQGCGEILSKTKHGQHGSKLSGEKEDAAKGAAAMSL